MSPYNKDNIQDQVAIKVIIEAPINLIHDKQSEKGEVTIQGIQKNQLLIR
ncbi:MAG: hypothetical protein ACLTKL_00835 [Streptococcus salivarius]